MYQGYLAIGGEDGVGTTELVNAMRTYAYARNLAPAMPLNLPEEYSAPDLPVLLGHEYDSPLADMAPWVDPDDMVSTEFLGLYPTALSGFEDSTWEAQATEFVRDGGVAGNGRSAGREMRVKGVMVALSEDGLNAGFTWLRNVLSDAACRDFDVDCGGESLIVLTAPPQVCPEETGDVIPGQVHPCLAPYVRQFYRVQCTQGVKVLRQWVSDCGPMAEVEFLLYAGVPQPHRLPEFIGLAQGDALQTFTNLVTNPSFEADLATVTGSTNAVLSRSGDWSAAGNASMLMEAQREADRTRRNFVLNPSFETDLSGWAKGDAPGVVEYAWTGAEDASTSTKSVSGAVQYTNLITNPRGRNTSGTVVVRENLCTNPSFEYGLDGWGTPSGMDLTQIVDSRLGMEGQYVAQVTPNGGAWNAGSAVLNNPAGSGMAVAEGDVISVGGRVVRSAASSPVSVRLLVLGYGSTGSYEGVVGTANNVSTLAGSPSSFNQAKIEGVTIPAGVVEVRLGWYMDSGFDPNNWTSGSLLFDAHQVVKSATLPPYADGDSTSSDSDLTWGWAGTSGNSVSQLTAPKPVGWDAYPATGSNVYYSARHDAVAVVGEGACAARWFTSATAGDVATFVAEVTADEPSTTAWRKSGAIDSPNVSGPDTAVQPGQWTRLETSLEFTGGAYGVWVWNRGVSATPVYFRAAIIDGTTTYQGGFFDGRTADIGQGDWTMARTTSDAFSGTASMLTTVTAEGGGVAYEADLADMSTLQRSGAMYVKVDAADPSITALDAEVEFRDSTGAAVGVREATFPLIPGGWSRVALATTEPSATAVTMVITLRPAADTGGDPRTFAVGDTILVDAALAEGSTLAGGYFDGDTPDEPGITYTWETDGSSKAVYRGVVSSTRVFADITDGAPLPYDIIPGVEYHLQVVLHLEEPAQQRQLDEALTLQMVWRTSTGAEIAVRSTPAPNTAGDHLMHLDFVVPDNVASGVLRLYGGTDVATYWDALMLTEGEPPHYFDGDTPDADGWTYQWVDATLVATYAWTGAPGASTSTKSLDGAVVATNMCPNPSFEYGTAGWSSVSGITLDRAESGVEGVQGSWVGTLTPDGTNTPTSILGWVSDIPVDDALPLSVAGSVRRSASDVPRSVRLFVRAYDLEGGGLGDVVTTEVSTVSGDPASMNRAIVEGVALPTGTKTVRLAWYLPAGYDASTWTTGALEIDAHMLVQAATVGPYFDGDSPDLYQGASLAEYNPIPPETIPDVVCDPSEVTVVLRRNLATNPGPSRSDGWLPNTARGAFDRSFVPDDSHRVGGQSARVERRKGNESIYMAYIDRLGYGNNASTRPRITPGRRYTYSVYVKTDRAGRARMSANARDASGTTIQVWRSQVESLTANTWTRLSVTFTAPQGSYQAAAAAWTYIDSTTEAPEGAVSWFTEALLEQSSSADSYFDGNFTDTVDHDYRWDGLPGASSSSIVHAESGDLLVDPDCPFVPDPPKPPVVVTNCIETPSEWTRYTVLVTNENVPLWGGAVPVVTINTGAAAARQVRIRFYPLVDPLNPLDYEECDYEGEFILTYLPPSTSLVIDGVRREAMASVGDSDPVSALNLLTGTGGMPYTWTALNCDRDYIMTVDVAPVAEDVTVSLTLVGRE